VEQLMEEVMLIDCQVYTEYLESLGARMIDRPGFISQLAQWTDPQLPNS
jgi:leucyl/phenylalanyl-tRNA--protein transferase